METLERNGDVLREKFSEEEFVSFIDSFYSGIKKRRWTNAEIQLKLGRRTINDILKSGETCFMGSCVDSTLAFLQKLKETGVDMKGISLGCELLKLRSNGVCTIHFFIQDNSSNPARIIDFVKAGEIAVYDGEYRNPKEGKEIDHVQNFFLSADSISGDDSFLTIATKMKLPVSEEYFAGYIKKIQIDNTGETYERFLKYESGLRISLNNNVALFKSVEEQKEATGGDLIENLNMDEEHKEFYALMNELWGIIGHLYGYPYGVVVGVERGLRSESDSTLEEKSKQDFLLGTHQDLLQKFGIDDAIEVTYIKLKSGAEIEITNTVRGQHGTWNSLESLMNYANRELQYEDPEKYKKFYDLWFKLQKFGKTSSSSESFEIDDKKKNDIKCDGGEYHYTHEGD